MLRLIAQRLGLGLLTLLAASVLIFAGTEILPGDLASAILQNNATPESLAEMRSELGLDRPAPVRYVEWLGRVASGDLGRSLASQRPVVQEILHNDGATIIPVFGIWLEAHSRNVGGHTPHAGFDMDNGWIVEKAWLKS